MNISIIQSRLDSYNCKTALEEENAMREIAQEIVLSGLSRAGFFKKAAFHGGTCLRIIYGMDRFSEDLDFALIKADERFSLKSYLDILCKELQLYGFEFSIGSNLEATDVVQKQLIRDNSIIKLITFKYFKPGSDYRKIRIKLEVDTHPPEGAGVEVKFHDYPFAYEIVVHNPESLFAGKCHALLCRKYIKGRDWYDFSWYVSRKTNINLKLLAAAIDQQGPWKGQHAATDKSWLIEAMKKRIAEIDWKKAADDVRRFLKPNELPTLDLWSVDFFNSRVVKLDQYMKNMENS